jgi:branched-chain amino acid transport system substrate-binding protein
MKSVSTKILDTAIKNRTAVKTPLGAIRFDDHGDAIGVGYSMYRVVDGQFYECPKDTTDGNGCCPD